MFFQVRIPTIHYTRLAANFVAVTCGLPRAKSPDVCLVYREVLDIGADD